MDLNQVSISDKVQIYQQKNRHYIISYDIFKSYSNILKKDQFDGYISIINSLIEKYSSSLYKHFLQYNSFDSYQVNSLDVYVAIVLLKKISQASEPKFSEDVIKITKCYYGGNI